MAKRISLSLCLLAGVIVAGVPARAAITTAPTVSQPPLTAKYGIIEHLLQIAAQPAIPTKATLTLEDLPSGFRELPPKLAASIAARLEVLTEELGQGNMKPENFFAFVNPKNFQIVLGFTGKLPNETEQTSFDASLEKVKQPEVQKRTLSLLQEKLKEFKEFKDIKVTEYRPIPEWNNLANASIGMTLVMEMKDQPLRLDLAAFRRDTMGALTGIIYANGKQPALGVGDLAQKLDRRIEQVSANPTASPQEKPSQPLSAPTQKPDQPAGSSVR